MSKSFNKSEDNRQNVIFLAVIGLLIAAGISAVAWGVSSQTRIPIPTQDPSQTNTTSRTGNSPNFGEASLSVSEPTFISIPAINVQSELIQVGKNPDGTIEVPSGDDYNKAAWYVNSSTPGQFGPSIIEGHVDSAEDGPSIFFNLGNLKAGDEVSIVRKDGMVAIFKIDEVSIYQKEEFPTEKVYGPTKHAALRLITCGGSLNRSVGQYDSNIIAFGHLIDTRKSTEMDT